MPSVKSSPPPADTAPLLPYRSTPLLSYNIAATSPTAPPTTAPTFPTIFLSAAPVNAAGGPDVELDGGAAAAAELEDAGVVLTASLEDVGVVLAASLEEEVSAAAEEEDLGTEADDDLDSEALELAAGSGFTTPPETVVGTLRVADAAAALYAARVFPEDLYARTHARTPISLVQYSSLIAIALSIPPQDRRNTTHGGFTTIAIPALQWPICPQ
jgi:hypothetical protein